MRRLLAILAFVLYAGSALAQSRLPPAIPQLRANPPGARFAIGLPAVPPATLRAPLPTDDSTKGYATNNYWLDIASGKMFQNLYPNVGSSGWQLVQPPPYNPLDGYATTPQFVIGTRRFLSSYLGPALQVRRTDTLATQDIAFLQDGWVDEGAGDTFCAGTTCEISIAYDQMGACNATGANGSAPFWDNSKRINGHIAISFNSISAHEGLGPPVSQSYFTIPNTCFTWSPANSTILMAGLQLGSSSNVDEYALFYTLDGAAGYLNTLNGRGVRLTGGSTDMAIPTQPIAWMAAATTGTFRVWVANHTQSQSHSVSGSYNGAFIGADGGAHLASRMWMQGFIFWNSALSTVAAEPPILSMIEQTLGYQRQYDNMVVDVGASNDTGTGEGYPGTVLSGNAVPNLGRPQLTPGAMVWNNSSTGATLAGVYTQRADLIGSVYTNMGGATTRNFVVVFSIVGNEIRHDFSFDYIKGYIQNFSTYVKSLGPNARFILSTQVFACDYASSPTQTAVLQQYNDWVYSSATKSVAEDGAGADGIYDRFGDTYINEGAYVTSHMCFNTLSYDGVHLLMPFQTSLAQRWADSVNAVLK